LSAKEPQIFHERVLVPNYVYIKVCMGWLRLVGSFKLYVSFAKEPYTRDDIQQKRPIILRSLLIIATPYLAKEPSGMYRVAWSHRMPYLHRSFSTKEP